MKQLNHSSPEEVVKLFEGGRVAFTQDSLGEYIKALSRMDRLDNSRLMGLLQVRWLGWALCVHMHLHACAFAHAPPPGRLSCTFLMPACDNQTLLLHTTHSPQRGAEAGFKAPAGYAGAPMSRAFPEPGYVPTPYGGVMGMQPPSMGFAAGGMMPAAAPPAGKPLKHGVSSR